MPSYIYTGSPGQAVQGTSIDNNRRLFAFGGEMAEITPQQSFFVSYLEKLRKRPTDDSTFKLLERRHQYQRKNFEVQAAVTPSVIAADKTFADVKITAKYDKYGRAVDTDTAPEFLLTDWNIVLQGNLETGTGTDTYEDAIFHAQITDVSGTDAAFRLVDIKILAINNRTDYATLYAGRDIGFSDGDLGQVIGSAFYEATGAPEGWTDSVFDREGYTQIFKTSIPVVSGSAQATRYRGIASEWAKVWGPKLVEHKIDMAHAFLFGVGRKETDGQGNEKRFTHGFIPYVERNGETETFTYASSGYDDFVEWLKVFMAPEKGGQGTKAVIASRNILAWFSKLGNDSFVSNTFGSASYQLDVTRVPGRFGQKITKIETLFGDLMFMPEMLLRGPYAEYACVVDMAHVSMRYLTANGVSRDTFIKTNVQANDLDGRKDLITTEAGLQVDLPEVHAVLKWS